VLVLVWLATFGVSPVHHVGSVLVVLGISLAFIALQLAAFGTLFVHAGADNPVQSLATGRRGDGIAGDRRSRRRGTDTRGDLAAADAATALIGRERHHEATPVLATVVVWPPLSARAPTG
jgi:hypothetical protein